MDINSWPLILWSISDLGNEAFVLKSFFLLIFVSICTYYILKEKSNYIFPFS